MSKALKLSRAVRGRGIASDLGPYRNKFINPGFEIGQRGQSFTIAAGTIQYTADRWTVYNRTNQPCTVYVWPRQPSVAIDGLHFPYLEVRFATAPTSGTVEISQPIESAYTLTSKISTLSLLASGPGNAAIAAKIVQRFGSTGSPSADVERNIVLNNAVLSDGFKKFTGIVSVPSVAGKTFVGDNHWLRPIIIVTPRASGNYFFARTSFVEGDATEEDDPFSPRSIEQEFALCQRYYEVGGVVSAAPYVRSASVTASSTSCFATVQFKVAKRIHAVSMTGTPSFATLNTWGNVSAWSATASLTANGSAGDAMVANWRADAEL